MAANCKIKISQNCSVIVLFNIVSILPATAGSSPTWGNACRGFIIWPLLGCSNPTRKSWPGRGSGHNSFASGLFCVAITFSTLKEINKLVSTHVHHAVFNYRVPCYRWNYSSVVHSLCVSHVVVNSNVWILHYNFLKTANKICYCGQSGKYDYYSKIIFHTECSI